MNNKNKELKKMAKRMFTICIECKNEIGLSPYETYCKDCGDKRVKKQKSLKEKNDISAVLEKLKAMQWLRDPFCDMDINKLTKQ